MNLSENFKNREKLDKGIMDKHKTNAFVFVFFLFTLEFLGLSV